MSCSEQSAFHGQTADPVWFFSELLFQSVAAKKKKKIRKNNFLKFSKFSLRNQPNGKRRHFDFPQLHHEITSFQFLSQVLTQLDVAKLDMHLAMRLCTEFRLWTALVLSLLASPSVIKKGGGGKREIFTAELGEVSNSIRLDQISALRPSS